MLSMTDICPLGLCPVDMALSFLQLCQALTCSKCAPCQIGLGQLANMMGDLPKYQLPQS